MANIFAQNVLWGYRLGGSQDGTPNFSGSATAAQCLARSIRRDVSYGTVDLAALCDTSAQQQVTKKSGTVVVELFVDATAGPIFQASNGYYAESVFTPKTGVTAITDQGVITNTGLSVDVDGALIETITITLGAHGIS